MTLYEWNIAGAACGLGTKSLHRTAGCLCLLRPPNAQLKAALVVPSYLVGGAERVFIDIANHMPEFIAVDFVTMTDDGPLRWELNSRANQVLLQANSYASFTRQLAHYYGASRPDVVMTSIYATGLAALAARFIAFHRPRIVVGAHNRLSSKISHPDNVKDARRLLPLSKALFRFADAIVCVSQGVKEDLKDTLALRDDFLDVIYNPVDSGRVGALAQQDPQHPWLKRERQAPVVACVGRLVPQKGYDILLRAMALVRKQLDAKLLVIGDGPAAPELRQLSARLALGPHVDFLGHRMNPHAYVSRSDLFALSSRWEGFGVVIIEALACGCRIVSTDCIAGPREILDNGKYGTLVPVDDHGKLAEAIVQALIRPATEVERATLIRRARQFSISASISQYVHLFDSLVYSR